MIECLQDFLEGRGGLDGIDDMDKSASAGSEDEDEEMSFASSGGAAQDKDLDEKGIWKEMQRILKLEEEGHPTSDDEKDDYLLGKDKDFGSDEDIQSASEGTSCPLILVVLSLYSNSI